METFFLLLFRFFQKRRTQLFIIVVLATIAATYLASRIGLEEDVTKMISGSENPTMMSRIVEQSRMLDKIIVTISAADTNDHLTPDELTAIGDRFADTLQSQVFKPYIKSVTYRVADTLMEEMFSIIYDNLPLFLEDADYAKLDTLIQPGNIEKALNNDLKNLLSPTSFTMKQMIVRDPVGISNIALRRLGSFQNDENYTIINSCIFSRDTRHLMMFLAPVYSSNETSKNSVFIDRLEDAKQTILKSTGNKAKIEYFGSAVIAAGNAQRLRKDIKLTLSITIVLLVVIITFSVKKKKLFPFIFLPAIFGGLVALAVIYLFQGKISVISLSVGSVMLAITVDYALHITTHYKHKHAIIDTIKDVSFPIMVCGIATAFDFLSLVFVSSESLHELGILAAISVLTAAFFTMVVLPHILDATHEESDETEEKNILEVLLDKVTNYEFHKNKVLLAVMIVITLLSLFYIGKIGFETDMMKMNYMSDELRQTENDLNRINNAKLNSIYVVAYGNDLENALISNEKILKSADSLKRRGIVKSYSSPGSLLMSDSLQMQKIRRWNEFWDSKKKQEFLKNVDQQAVLTGFRPGSFTEFEAMMNKQYTVADSGVYTTIKKIFFVDNISVSPGLASVVTILKVDNQGKEITNQAYSNRDGVLVIDRKSVLSNMVNTLGSDFSLIANISLIFILCALIIAFGRIELGVITFLPILLSWLWTMGFMGLFDIRFNIFNIIISSFITGLGIDYSIYIMQGLVQGFKTENENLLSYKTCILVSVLISISGTGVLILAKHPALNSIALISIVGLLSIVLIAYVVEPIFFDYLINKKGQKRQVPLIFSDIVVTLFVFSLFALGCLFMNVMLVVVLLLPVSARIKRLLLHRAMMLWCKVPVYAMLHIKKTIINPQGEDFSKPALIISNHQSHIDLLLLLMLHPKLIVLTTKWVWNNPVYALVIRYLNYYPVMDGYEGLIDKLKNKIEEGYSVIVFPEGSRSPDSSVMRFHKGAFLLAHELGIDVLPIIIHGAGDCMNKGENHLKGGSVTVKIYPRVKPGDAEYGSDYHDMTRLMLAFYRTEYARVKEERETPAYFRKKLIRNYIYKGPVLEWYLRIKMTLENNYQQINNLVPRKAKIVDIGCGYGYLSYMLSFVSSERQLLGIDYDNDKIELANHCISKNENLHFIAADVTSYNFEHADVFILSDVLHYLPEDNQIALLENCISHMNPHGKVIIRDADKDLKKRHKGTQYTEFFSTRSGFNKSDHNKLFFFSGNRIREIADRHGLDLKVKDNTRLTSNILYVLENKRVN